MLAKSVIIIYALGSVHEKFGVWIKAVLKSEFPAGLGVKNGWAVYIEIGIPNWLRRRTFMYLIKRSASEPGLSCGPVAW